MRATRLDLALLAAQTEAGGLERSLSVTGNFGAGSGSGALMKGSRFAADSMLEGSGFEL
jgi:hypothetical protein